MISKRLITATFQYFNSHRANPNVVTPSIPILYFGDEPAYRESEIKIVTVGKNPSDNEFRLNKNQNYDIHYRFPSWNPLTQNLQQSLNDYFKRNPLKNWFSSFEPILNGASCSYYNGELQKNIALHTDICSPLATNPTWSNLPTSDKNNLFANGVKIWWDLIEELQPDCMLVSVPKNLFSNVFGFKIGSGTKLINFSTKKNGTQRKPYNVEYFYYSLKSGKKIKIVFGPAANVPFGTISKDQKFQIGQLC